ncbi:metal ABC transporter substrate-binding protein [Microvirga sp. W0021]|uniref:Metal ABC transporter substrate-binding protein n=1 Tax=Hohaiivirga grylli TaxID=3133970 RepID=A0ABV0BK98_9HYPH
MFWIRKHILIPLVSLLLVAPLLTTANAQQNAPKKIVATFSILGDIVQNIAGDRGQVSVLVQPGGDAHVYSPSATDVRTIKEADIIFENGLSFEGWIKRLISSSGTSAKVITASKGITPLDIHPHSHDGHDHASDHNHHDDTDPHAWQDVANVKIYVANIRDALIELDPEGKETYTQNADHYLEKLDQVDQEIRTVISALPIDHRKVITPHDAFGYFANAYGITFIGVQGISSASEASAKDVAKIIRRIKTEKIPAVFIETLSNPRLIKQISQETGAKIGDPIFSDSLSPKDGPAPTYLKMMEYNIKALQKALAK